MSVLSNQNNMLTLSMNAKNQIQTLIDRYREENGLDAWIRVDIEKQGCSAIAYTMEYILNPDPSDHLTDEKICVAPTALMFVIGVELDYKVTDCKEGFEFISKISRKSCHCGRAVKYE